METILGFKLGCPGCASYLTPKLSSPSSPFLAVFSSILLPSFLKPTPPSIVNCTRFLEVTGTFYWLWRYFTYHKWTMLTERYKAHALFMNTHTVVVVVVVIITDTQAYYYIDGLVLLWRQGFHVPFSLLELYWCLIKIANRLLVPLEGDYIVIVR